MEEEEKRRTKPLRLQRTPNLSHMHTQTAIKKQKQNTFCSQWKIYVTPTISHTEKHSLCNGMNKPLHTLNFLGHHAILHYHCNPLGELYPVFSLCQAQIVPKTGNALSETSNRRQLKKITQACTQKHTLYK